MTRLVVLSAIIAMSVFAGNAVRFDAAAQPATTPAIGLQKLKDNLYLLTGGGTNSLAFITDLGVVLVDTKLPGYGKAIADKLKTITAKPVTTIINTHAHAESVGGNEFFPTSVEIIAHENTRLTMAGTDAFKGAKVNFLPKLMFREKMTVGAGKDRIDLYYFGAARTGGDAVVVFPALRVADFGDLVRFHEAPIVDPQNGGSAVAYPDTLAKAVEVLRNIDSVVIAHGPAITMKDVAEYAAFSRDFRDSVVSGLNHGFGISEVAPAWALPARYQGYAAPPDRIRDNVRTIFSELTK